MIILAIDTSSPNATVAVRDDNKLLGEYSICNKRTHSQIIMPMLDDMLKKLELDISQIDVFCTTLGPGSFTGLRIGIATVKSLAHALGKKIIGVSTLCSMAQNFYYSDKYICPMIDARRKDVYTALFYKGERLKEDYAINLYELLNDLKGKETVFLGDGAVNFKDEIIEVMGENAFISPQSLMMPRASALADIAYKRALNNDFDNINRLEPIYLRVSQAEREFGGNQHKD